MFLLNIFTLLKYFLVLKIYEDRTIKKKKKQGKLYNNYKEIKNKREREILTFVVEINYLILKQFNLKLEFRKIIK